MESIQRTEETCIIVVEIKSERDGDGKRSIGVIVDRVSEVLNIAGDNIEPPPEFGAAVETGFILGLGKVGKSVKILLDIDRVLSAQETAKLNEITDQAARAAEIAAA
jgi:purine-binding chemotaxis protein CheW